MSPTVSEREKVQGRLFETAGISLDLEHNRVKTAGDLDYVSLVVNGTVTGERLQKVAAALPFPLSNEEKQRIGEKAVAKWSLQSNTRCNREPRIVRASRRRALSSRLSR
jgi:hypothetical protein